MKTFLPRLKRALGLDTCWEWQYLDLLKKILETGEDRMDRTGTGTRAIFGETIKIDLSKEFPATTTKKLAWKAVVSELLWFLEGSGDERRLAEILHGTRDKEKQTIWTANAEAGYWAPKAKYDGDLGRVYGVQWRSWQTYTHLLPTDELPYTTLDLFARGPTIDQVSDVIKKINTNPTDRRIIISAWNVGEINDMALPPCHMFAQFFVSADRVLSCQMYQRSVDVMLGLPFNIASYALLTHLIAAVTGCTVGTLTMVLGDTHIYQDHLDGAREQLKRVPWTAPTLVLNDAVPNIDSFTMKDIALLKYNAQDAIKLKMSA